MVPSCSLASPNSLSDSSSIATSNSAEMDDFDHNPRSTRGPIRKKVIFDENLTPNYGGA